MAEQAALSLIHQVVPARRPVVGRRPGLLLLHGRGADEMDLLGLVDALDPRFTVVAARAPHRWMVGYYWYDMDNLGAPEPGTYAAARAALERFVDEAIAAYQFEPASLYVLGFSQGAMMAGGLTLVRPSRLAGSVLLSGYLPADRGLQVDLTGLRHKPILVAHGAHDPVIPVQFGRAARDELTRLGADVTYREYPIEHSISLDELADVAAWLTAQLDRTTGAKRQRSDS